ncbi:UNVERIFIED_CONTAM: hypothetical protein PYX00_006772 [Menopon gallinae]|uniref:Uncharacterized protein n=1 Tax=Menopon gallinae TaxID=328185 RepID=A0AAW2HWH6_9NEOP
MTYVSRGDRVFNRPSSQYPDCSPPAPKRSDGRLKRYESITDDRVWSLEEEQRYQYLYNLMSGSRVCLSLASSHKYIPLEELINIICAEKDAYIKSLENQLGKEGTSAQQQKTKRAKDKDKEGVKTQEGGGKGTSSKGPGDRGYADKGAASKGPGDRGFADKGAASKGPGDRGSADKGAASKGPGDRGSADKGGADKEGRGSASADRGGADKEGRGSASADRGGADKEGRGSASADKGGADKGGADKEGVGAADRGASSKGPSARGSVDKGSVGRGSIGRGSVDKGSVGKGSVGKDSVGRGSVGKDSAGRGSVGKDSAGRGSAPGKGSTGKGPADKRSPGKTSAGEGREGGEDGAENVIEEEEEEQYVIEERMGPGISTEEVSELYKASPFVECEEDDESTVCMRNKIFALTAELEESKNARETLRQAMNKLENIEDIVNENEELKNKLRCSEEMVKYLEEKKSKLEKELENLRTKSQIEMDLSDVQANLRNIDKKEKVAKEPELSQLRKERDNLQKKVGELQNELREMKTKQHELELLRKKSESASMTLDELARENECYKKKLASMKSLEQQIQELKQQANVLADKYKRDSLRNVNQDKLIEALCEDRDRLRRKVDELTCYESQYNSLQCKLQQVDAIISENERLNHKLETLDKLEMENKYLRCKLDQSKATEQEAAEGKERIRELQEAVADQEEEMKDLLCQIERLTRAYVGGSELDQLKQELSEKDGKLKLCEEQLAEIPLLEAEIDELRLKLEDCCKNMSDSGQKQKKDDKKKNSVFGSRFEEPVEKKEGMATVEQADGESDGMTCEEVQNLLRSSKGIISCVLEDMIEHQKEMEELEKCNREMKEEIRQLKEHMNTNDGVQEVDELKKSIEEKQKMICRLQEQISRSGDLGKVNDHISNLECEIEYLKSLNKKMRQDLEEACCEIQRCAELECMLEEEKRARQILANQVKSKSEKEEYNLETNQIDELKKLVAELKKENCLLKEMQSPCPDYMKEMEEKNELENLLNLLQCELDVCRKNKAGNCDELRNEVERLRNQNNELKNLIDCYSERLALEKNSGKDSHVFSPQDENKLRSEITHLRCDVIELCKKIEELEGYLADKCAEIECLKQCCKNLEKKNDQLEREVDEKDYETESLRSEVSKLIVEQKRLSTDNESLKSRLKESESPKVIEPEEELEKDMSEKDEIDKTMKIIEDQVDELSQKLEEGTKSGTDQDNLLKQQEDELERLRKRLKEAEEGKPASERKAETKTATTQTDPVSSEDKAQKEQPKEPTEEPKKRSREAEESKPASERKAETKTATTQTDPVSSEDKAQKEKPKEPTEEPKKRSREAEESKPASERKAETKTATTQTDPVSSEDKAEKEKPKDTTDEVEKLKKLLKEAEEKAKQPASERKAETKAAQIQTDPVKFDDGKKPEEKPKEEKKADQPKREEPKREEPKREEPKREEPKREEPKREEPKREEPKREEPKREEPKREEQKREEPKREEPKREEPKREEPKREEPKREEPKREEPKREEPKREEPKREEKAPEKAKPEETKPEEEKRPVREDKKEEPEADGVALRRLDDFPDDEEKKEKPTPKKEAKREPQEEKRSAPQQPRQKTPAKEAKPEPKKEGDKEKKAQKAAPEPSKAKRPTTVRPETSRPKQAEAALPAAGRKQPEAAEEEAKPLETDDSNLSFSDLDPDFAKFLCSLNPDNHKENIYLIEKRYRKKMTELQRKNEEKVKALLTQFDRESNMKDKMYKDRVNSIKSGYETDIRKLAERHRASIMRLQSLHEDEIQELNTTYETEMDALQTQNENIVNDITTGAAEKFKMLAEQHNKDIRNLEKKYQQLLEEKEMDHAAAMPSGVGDMSVEDIKTKHNRELKKLKESNLKRVDLMRHKYEDLLSCERKKYEKKLEELVQRLRQGKPTADGVCQCKTMPPVQKDPNVPLEFNDVLRKILHFGLESLNFNEVALVHRKTCAATEEIVLQPEMKAQLLPPIADDPCAREQLLKANKEELLQRILVLENEIAAKQMETQNAIINMEKEVKAEKERLLVLRDSLRSERENTETRSKMTDRDSPDYPLTENDIMKTINQIHKSGQTGGENPVGKDKDKRSPVDKDASYSTKNRYKSVKK